MNYLYIIKQLLAKKNYEKYRQHIKVNKQDKEIYWLFKALDDIHSHSEHDLSLEDYALWVQVNLGNDYNTFLELIKQQENNDELIETVLTTIKEKGESVLLAEAALKFSEGRLTKEELITNVDAFYESINAGTAANVPFVNLSLEEIYNGQIRTPGLRWRLNCLNRSLGSIRKGDFGVVFARPETGKTTFLASEVTNFALQSNSTILWFNNEEAGPKVLFRCYQASLGATDAVIGQNLVKAAELYKERTKDLIKIYDSAAIHKHDVEKVCKEFNPGLIVFDQLSKIKGFNNDREDLRLGHTFAWARELAKTYAPTIAVNQADVSGEGKKYLTMDNVANAKTAIQAEADWILGIGKSHDNGFEYIRHLNISKNKLIGDEDTDPRLRHGKFDVLIQPEIARYRDL